MSLARIRAASVKPISCRLLTSRSNALGFIRFGLSGLGSIRLTGSSIRARLWVLACALISDVHPYHLETLGELGAALHPALPAVDLDRAGRERPRPELGLVDVDRRDLGQHVLGNVDVEGLLGQTVATPEQQRVLVAQDPRRSVATTPAPQPRDSAVVDP